MGTSSLSVVIPTHKRTAILQQTLEHLERQTVADRLEVIVVSDGPDDVTGRMVASRTWKMSVQYLDIPKSQQGIARNRGVSKATGERTLFIGDDIFLAPDACAKHLLGTDGMLGFTTWDPAVGITPVMRWLEATGWQFGYPMLAPYAHRAIPSSMQHRFTYTSHISIPTSVAQRIRFRDDVTLYGWEDIEWGSRLKEDGVALIYEPDAKALHHHHVMLEDSLKRMETIGKSAVIMEKAEPSLQLVPRGMKYWKYRLVSLFPTMRGRHAAAFLRGIGLQTT
jgi:glycosyltransferase involved in cell wall biosynthesis